MTVESLVRKLFWRLGLDVKRATLPGTSTGLMLNLLEFSQADLVLDVGANEGQFATELLSYRPNQPILSFEPGSEAHRKLNQFARRFPNWVVADRVALGAERGRSTLNLTQNSQCASLRKVAEAGPKLGTLFDAAGCEDVNVERLDCFSSPRIERAKRMYLKMDVQGFENEVFTGARNLLDRIEAIQVELSMKEVYEGQHVGLASLQQFIDGGYALYGISNGWRDRDTQHLIQFDAFLIKNASLSPDDALSRHCAEAPAS